MDILSRQFSNELVKIIQLIADSHFVAFDLEFSGIANRRLRGGKSRSSLQQVYEEVKEAAKVYQVLQVGLTIVEEDSQKGQYVARPYNFYINPIPLKEDYHRLERVWSYQSGAISFLLKNKFRFDLPFSEGITYLSRKEEAQIRASWAVKDAERAAIEDMELKVEDKPLVDHIHLSVRNWLSQSLVEREDYLNIPHTTQESPRVKDIGASLNRYQMRLTHQIIRNDYSNLKTTGKDGFIRITTRNEKDDAGEKKRQERYRELDVIQCVEFRWLIEALCGGDISKIPEKYFLAAMQSSLKNNDDDAHYKQFVDDLQEKVRTRRRVLFGHNCFTDLVYLYACFIGDLPEMVEDFQEYIHELFPAVVDTKYLASLVKELKFHSNLESLEKEMRKERAPIIDVPIAFDRYVWGERYHEAGYDSYMTAKVAIKLSAKLEREGKLREPHKPQRIVKAGKTILVDPTVSTEDEEQMDEYVTASESAAETESIMTAVVSKLSTLFSASEKRAGNISQPFDARKLPKPDSSSDSDPQAVDVMIMSQMQHEAESKTVPDASNDLTLHSTDNAVDTTANENPAAENHIVAVKEEALESRCTAEVKRVKNPVKPKNLYELFGNLDDSAESDDPTTEQTKALERSTAEVKRVKNPVKPKNLYELLGTPDGSVDSDIPATGQTPDTQSIPAKYEDALDPEQDLLDLSDDEGQDGDRPLREDVVIDKHTIKLSAEELEDKLNDMAKKGEMMPRWESDSGMWNVIGNKLVVNACEEGVCIL